MIRRISAKIKSGELPQYEKYLFMVVCIWLLTFEEPVTHLGFPGITIFRNIIPLLAIAYFLVDPYGNIEGIGSAGGTTNGNASGSAGSTTGGTGAPARSEVTQGGIGMRLRRSGKFRAATSPMAVLGFIFTAAGMAGWLMNGYQSFSITTQAMYEHVRFWICLWALYSLLTDFPLEKYARRLFCHVGILSAIFIVLSAVDAVFKIWPRQIYRFGIGSIQLFFGHPSNYGAHCVFLLAMLCILIPHLKAAEKANAGRFANAPLEKTAAILAFGMLMLVVATLRLRLVGFAAFFVILFIFMIVMKNKLHPGVVTVGILVALAIGWKRIYFFFFSRYAFTMARGQFAINSLNIAKDNLPFGSGFGTFGSRMAQIHYSPLYYKYHMMITPGMQPNRPSYACDSFYPMILGESGWLGFVAYLGLIILLAALIFSKQKEAAAITAADVSGPVPGTVSRWTVFTAFILLLYELSETTGTLAFSETYSVAISLALGLALAQIGKIERQSRQQSKQQSKQQINAPM